MTELPEALRPLGAYQQFILYEIVPSITRLGKTDKFPCDFRTAQRIDAHNPIYWTTVSDAIIAATIFGPRYGAGFVLTDNDPFFCIDIDSALINGQWSSIAVELCNLFAGCGVEVSQSMEGLHIFGTGHVPKHMTKNSKIGVELYTSSRFIALTGTGAIGNALQDMSHVMPAFVEKYFPADTKSNNGVTGWTDTPSEDWDGPLDDGELIEKILSVPPNAGVIFTNKASFADLWNNNTDVLGKCYPPNDTVRDYDASSVDAAIAQHLAFWTGCNCQRIYNLMMGSKLYRDKYERFDYMRRTILNAVGGCEDVYKQRAVVEALAPIVVEAAGTPVNTKLIEGMRFLDRDAQIKLFTGCVYIRDAHRILVPGGDMLKPDQFRVTYGGHTFSMDGRNEKVSRDAWEAFTQSQLVEFPKADRWAFRPDLPFGEIWLSDDLKVASTYWPLKVKRTVGDVTPFLKHLEKMIPNDRDRLIALSYIAACVQHVGTKFQWCLVLQGVEGNGKSMIGQCMSEAIGSKYVYYPAADKIGAQFNSWLPNHVLYVIEDVYVNRERSDIIEKLKPMITGGYKIEVEAKGVDGASMQICGNFIFSCNKKNAIPKDNKDRRYCIQYTAQQSKLDLTRDGMDGNYMPTLWDWLKKEDGYAIVSEFLHTFPIPSEYNPAAKCHRAPDTTSTADAIRLNVGPVEQEMQEAIDQALPGFKDGWVSSHKLGELLQSKGYGKSVGPYRRAEILAAMGYIKHPGLVDGRTTKLVLPDNCRPRLYVKDGHDSLGLGDLDICMAYEKANNFVYNF